MTPSLVGRSPLLDRALAVAAWAHRGQVRRSWPRPYVEHCVEVAEVLAAHGVEDERLLAAALLHDVLEDTDVGADELARLFGEDVVALVEALSEDARRPHDERKAAHLRRLRAAPAGAVLVFAADKLVGVRDLAARLSAPAADHPPLTGTVDAKLAHAREALALAELVPPGSRALFDELEGALEQAEGLRGTLLPTRVKKQCHMSFNRDDDG